jgi:hypothetical protein
MTCWLDKLTTAPRVRLFDLTRLRFPPNVHRMYIDDEAQREKFEDRSVWSLHVAFTGVVKQVLFSFTFAQIKGRVVAIHSMAWNQLDVSDPATGQLLTDRSPTSYRRSEDQSVRYLDYFHGAIPICPNSVRVVDDDWVGHQVGVPIGGDEWLTGTLDHERPHDRKASRYPSGRIGSGGLSRTRHHQQEAMPHRSEMKYNYDPSYREMLDRGVRKGSMLRLLRGHDVYLTFYENDGLRFAAQFRATWKRIPLRARRKMLKFWKESGHVSIELTRVQQSHRGSLAHVFLGGRIVRFRTKIARMPDSVVQDLIAHELGHVVQHALAKDDGVSLREYFAGPNADEGIAREMVEEDVAHLIEEWGFDPDSCVKWLRSTKARVRKGDRSG